MPSQVKNYTSICSFNNIVYKLIEHGQYGELFEALKSLKKEQLEEAQKSLF